MPTRYSVGDLVVFRYSGAGQAGGGYTVHVGETCTLIKHLGGDEWYVRFPTPFEGKIDHEVWLSEAYMEEIEADEP